MKPLSVRWLAGLLLLAVAISGCYGSTRPVVKIGLIAPFEELYRDDGYEVLNAVRLAVNQRNLAGGVAGRDVALVALNDNGRPDEARRQAANMAIDGDVLGVIGPVKAGSVSAGQALSQRETPWIALTELQPAELAGGFSLALTPETLVRTAIDDLLTQPGVSSALLLSDWPEAQTADAADSVRSLPLASAESVTTKPGEGVVWLGDSAQGARLAMDLGSTVVLVGGSEVGSHMFAGRAGSDAAKAMWLSAAPGIDQMPTGFVEAYRSLAGAAPGPQAVLAYDAANLLLDAIELAAANGAAPDRSAVQQALLKLGNDGWHGSVDTVRWVPGCDIAAGCGRLSDGAVYLHPVK